jgi:hypothetical protein
MITGDPHTPLQNDRRTQCAPDAAHVTVLPFELEDGSAGDDFQAIDPRKHRYRFFGETVAETFLL